MYLVPDEFVGIITAGRDCLMRVFAIAITTLINCASRQCLKQSQQQRGVEFWYVSSHRSREPESNQTLIFGY